MKYTVKLPDKLTAPIAKGQQIGTLSVSSGERELYCVALVSDTGVARADFGATLLELLKSYVGLG